MMKTRNKYLVFLLFILNSILSLGYLYLFLSITTPRTSFYDYKNIIFSIIFAIGAIANLFSYNNIKNT